MNIKQSIIFKIKYLEMLIKQNREVMEKAEKFCILISYQAKIDYFEEQLKDLNNYLNDLK